MNMKTLKSKASALMIALAAACTLSCGGGKTEKSSAEIQRDSVEKENQRLNQFIDIVASSMDSINGREKMIFVTKEGVPLSNKKQIYDNLKVFQYTLNEQRKRIAELEAQLGQRDDERSRKFRSIIAGLNQQIAEKEEMIAQLQRELQSKNVDIANLKTHVSKLNKDVEQLNQTNTETTAQLSQATSELEKMNTGYIKIGTKKQLSAAGLLKGGFLSKKRIDMSNIDNSKFQAIDIRHSNEFNIAGRNVKLMTQHPSSAYKLEEHGSHAILTITNPKAFWEASRYLVIMHK